MKRLLLAAVVVLSTVLAPHLRAEDSLPAAVSDAAEYPTIVSVRGRTVIVRVPEGYGRVSLERLAARQRTWTPFATQNCGGVAGDVVFKIKTPVSRRLLRVTGVRAATLPENYLTGRSEYLAPKGYIPPVEDALEARPFDNSLMFASATTNGTTPSTLALDSTVSAQGGGARLVAEGDIWKLDGDRLYFFNQYRGLQVLDVSDPNSPKVMGQLRMPVGGDEMYVFNGHVALLLPRWQWWGDTSNSSELSICSVADGKPVEVARIPLEGTPTESRMVGTALYVASNQMKSSGGSYWNVTVVTGYDLSNPANPIKRNSVEVTSPGNYGWAEAVWSNEKYFVAARASYEGNDYKTYLGLLDISNPDGTVVPRGTAVVKGFVKNKFNISATRNVLSVVSDYNGWNSTTGAREMYAHLENFDISRPDAPRSMGELDMGHGEMVRATRYDDDRVYVVTAIRMDPLWLVDNSNPARPRLVSHLEVPGWSTFIQPLGDRLVTVGVMPSDNANFWSTRVAVSLYDVADPAHPRLLSQLPVGGNFSSSEANWNEKAFTVLPEDGLILVPFTDGGLWMWDSWGAKAGNGIQLVDLGRDALTLRGIVKHQFTPRRSAVHKGSVLALSDRDLLSVDITDRDKPVVTSDLELAWTVDRVWQVGDFLLQLDKGGSYYTNTPSPSLTVTLASSPDVTMSVVNLGKEQVLGADVKDGLLTVVTRAAMTADIKTGAGRESVRLTVYDVTSLPQVVKKGTVLVRDRENRFYSRLSDVEMLWPAPHTLVAAVRNEPQYFHFGGPIGMPIFIQPITIGILAPAVMPTIAASDMLATASLSFAPNYYSSHSKNLVAFDISNPRMPRHVASVSLPKSSNSVAFSKSFVSAGQVFTSRQDYYKQRYFLDVVDFFTPGSPVVGRSISFAGELFGISNDGAVLFSRGPEFDTDGNAKAFYQQTCIHATSFDGATVHLLDSIVSEWNASRVSISDTTFFVPRFYDGIDKSRIESWQFGVDAMFIKLGEIPALNRNSPSYALCNDVLIESDYGRLRFWDVTNPAALVELQQHYQQASYPLIDHAIGNKADGLLIPNGEYGVESVKFQ